MSDGICPTCGAKTVEYRHRLSRPLVRALAKLARAGGGPINLAEVGLTRNEWDNFQKLRYWGLVASVTDATTGRRRAGIWRLTHRGHAFLTGRVRVPERVWTYRGEFHHYEDGRDVTAADVTGERYEQREEYAAEALPLTSP